LIVNGINYIVVKTFRQEALPVTVLHYKAAADQVPVALLLSTY
jgi:hypothetical protein